MFKKIILLSSLITASIGFANTQITIPNFVALNVTSHVVAFSCGVDSQPQLLGGDASRILTCNKTTNTTLPSFLNQNNSEPLYLGCLFGGGVVIKLLAPGFLTSCLNSDNVGIVFSSPQELQKVLSDLHISNVELI